MFNFAQENINDFINGFIVGFMVILILLNLYYIVFVGTQTAMIIVSVLNVIILTYVLYAFIVQYYRKKC